MRSLVPLILVLSTSACASTESAETAASEQELGWESTYDAPDSECGRNSPDAYDIFIQKLEYTHQNPPVAWNTATKQGFDIRQTTSQTTFRYEITRTDFQPPSKRVYRVLFNVKRQVIAGLPWATYGSGSCSCGNPKDAICNIYR